MSQKPIKINIDTINDDTVINYNNIRKGDTLKMTINISQASASLNLTGQSIHIILKKSDGYSVEKKVNSVTGSSFIVDFDIQATLSIGNVEGEIQLIDSNGTNISNHFIFEVGKTNADDIIIKSSDQIETLQQIIGLIDSYNDNADNLAVQNQLAIQNKEDLLLLNSESEQSAIRLETDIENGTNIIETIESDSVTGNQLHSNLQQDFSIGIPLHNNLLLDIANGNYTISQLQGLNWPYIQSMFNLLETVFIGMPLTDENNVELTDENDVVLTM